MARPTLYSEQIIIKAEEYLKTLPEDEIVHSIEGLAEYLGITRPTIYDWESQVDKPEFSYIVEQVRQKQSKTLVNKGLKGDFNSSIAKVMMSKHGYHDKTETDITTKGESINASNPQALSAAEKAYLANLDGTTGPAESS